MNPLIKKEIRLLLPSFLIGVVLAFANWFLKEERLGYNDYAFFVSFIFCPAIAVFMALNSFGAEISAGTFSMLLAQPVSRNRLWQTKASLLAAAFLISGFLWCAILYLRVELFKVPVDAGYFRNLFVFVGLFLLVVYSGALWTVLLLRQVAAAFWFTLLTPGALLVLITSLWPQEYAAAEEPVVITALLIYSVAGIWFARRLFLRAQDVAWTGGTIALPEMRGLARFKIGSGRRRWWRPRAALQVKEFQLHQAQFIMAGALTLLHIGVLATRKFGSFHKNSSLELVLESFWLLWLVMPLLVGCAAAAEERKMGTLEGQLCLPVRRRTQFTVKAGGVLLLSLLFGVAMPLLLEGARILPNVHSNFGPITAMLDWQGATKWQLHISTAQAFWWNCFGRVVFLLPLFTLTGIAAAIGLISFYASTLARNTLQALAPAVLGLLLAYFLIVANAMPGALWFHLPWRGSLIFFIGVPVLAATLLALASWNFKRVLIGWQGWRRNTLVWLAMLGLVAVATTAIYHRAWEKLVPFEPTHGAAQLSLSNPARLSQQWDTLWVRLPDGRIWTDSYALNIDRMDPLALFLGNIRLTSWRDGHFYAGSNWITVVRSPWNEQVGIKTDGTLWVSEYPPRRQRSAKVGWEIIKAGDLVRYGSATNWSSLVWNGMNVLLVKHDGTLWCWGVTEWNYRENHEWPDFQTLTPQRLGAESNWKKVIQSDYQPCLLKTDGSVWTTWVTGRTNLQFVKLEPGLRIERAPFLEHEGQYRSTTKTWFGLSVSLGVCMDGTFRVVADQKLNPQSHSYEWATADLRLGLETNWLAVAGHHEKIITLKDDGTLWLWPFHYDWRRGFNYALQEREMLEVKPVRLGTHSDWIAIANADGGIISLAADGSLWYWPLEGADYFGTSAGERMFGNSNSHFEPLLDISRKPQPLGNVFSGQAPNDR